MSDLFSWRPKAADPPPPPPLTGGGPAHLQVERWMRHLFRSQIAQDGGIVRRKLRDIDRIVGRAPFEAELRLRGYRAVINGKYVVIFCNRAALEFIG